MNKALTTQRDRRELFANAKRLLVKIGSSLVMDADRHLELSRMEKLVGQLLNLKSKGKEIILVASGAIAVGSTLYKPIHVPEDEFEAQQAAAAIGQCLLIEAYRSVFAKFGYKVAQLLVTRRQLASNTDSLKLSNTINALLLDRGVIPIFNENDPFSLEGARLRENDKLAVILACFCRVDLLLLLSDVAGLFSADPRANPKASLLKTVYQIPNELEAKKTSYGPSRGIGGMSAKIDAAKIALNSGMPMLVADGNEDDLFEKLMVGTTGTLFLSQASRRKYKDALLKQPKGILVVAEGAKEAIVYKGRSLLVVGIIDIQGQFASDDLVVIVDRNMNEFARGLAEWSHSELKKRVRKKKAILGGNVDVRDSIVIVHRDRMAIV